MSGSCLGRNVKTVKTNNITLKFLSHKEKSFHSLNMKPAVVADEMFPEGAGPYMDLEEAGGSSGLLMDLATSEKAVHGDFFNDFEDLYDDEDIS